jgi:hypothetical protein
LAPRTRAAQRPATGTRGGIARLLLLVGVLQELLGFFLETVGGALQDGVMISVPFGAELKGVIAFPRRVVVDVAG